MNYIEFWLEATTRASEFAYKTAGDNVMIYPCGFAKVVIKEKNHPLLTWLKQSGIVQKNYSYESGGSGWMIWISDFNQSMRHKYAYACKLGELLNEQGIKTVLVSKLD